MLLQVPLVEGFEPAERDQSGVVHPAVGAQRLLQDQTLRTLQAAERSATRHHAVRRNVPGLQSRRQFLLRVRRRLP